MPTQTYSTPSGYGCWTLWVQEGTADAANYHTRNFSTTYSSNTTVFEDWCNDGTTASYSSSNAVWTVWTNSPPDSIVVADIPDPWISWTETEISDSTEFQTTRYVPSENFIIEEVCPAMLPKSKETIEQRRARKAQYEINRIWNEILAEELQAEKEEAENVAMELLGDLIGDDQLEIYRKTGRLLVHGNKHDWLVRKGGIIAKVEKGKLIDHCVHLKNQYSYPPTDNVISLALRIKENERSVEQIANRRSTPKPLDELKAAANF